jgi:protein-S-isoprenylcysteine O-methyltransferase Ste14
VAITLPFLSRTPEPHLASARFALAAPGLVGGALLFRASVRALGPQWSLAAYAGERLVRSGPYARVRHPVYGAFLLLVLATAVALSPPVVVLISGAVFVAGTSLRVRAEETLLASTFGDAWRRYASAVPGHWPARPRWAAAPGTDRA